MFHAIIVVFALLVIIDDSFADLRKRQVHGYWSQWSATTACSVTCGPGTKTRTRACIGSTYCPGLHMETQPCSLHPVCNMGLWNNWAPWTVCSRTCGPAQQTRIRACIGGACIGLNQETRACNHGLCNLGYWSEWTAWTLCSKTCGSGQEYRTRVCIAGSCVGLGLNKEIRACVQQICPIGYWTEWTPYTPCSQTCGVGQETRRRTCVLGECPGLPEENRACVGLDTCYLGYWTEWTAVTACSATCGPGQRSRRRTCVPGPGGAQCPGLTEEIQACTNDVCPF